MPAAVTLNGIAALLRGERVTEPHASARRELLDLAHTHGVSPLVARAAASAGWSREFADAIRPSVAAEAALSVVRARELRAVLGALHAAGVRPLLIKGAALEWTHYPAPGTRPRTDTDLLIAEADRDHVRHILEARSGAGRGAPVSDELGGAHGSPPFKKGPLGYQALAHVTGDVAFGQFHYWRIDEAGARHALDVHWRIVNPRLVADRITYEDLYRARRTVPQLGPAAYAPSSADALQIACLHRSAHHRNAGPLIWLYDIHLLARSLNRAQWAAALDATIARGLEDFVHLGLEAAIESFRTPVPQGVRDRLAASVDRRRPETAEFAPERADIHLLLSDLRHLRGWTPRVRLLREHLLPPPAYIAHRYRTSNRALLPFLYLHRIVTGARRWF